MQSRSNQSQASSHYSQHSHHSHHASANESAPRPRPRNWRRIAFFAACIFVLLYWWSVTIVRPSHSCPKEKTRKSNKFRFKKDRLNSKNKDVDDKECKCKDQGEAWSLFKRKDSFIKKEKDTQKGEEEEIEEEKEVENSQNRWSLLGAMSNYFGDKKENTSCPIRLSTFFKVNENTQTSINDYTRMRINEYSQNEIPHFESGIKDLDNLVERSDLARTLELIKQYGGRNNDESIDANNVLEQDSSSTIKHSSEIGQSTKDKTILKTTNLDNHLNVIERNEVLSTNTPEERFESLEESKILNKESTLQFLASNKDQLPLQKGISGDIERSHINQNTDESFESGTFLNEEDSTTYPKNPTRSEQKELPVSKDDPEISYSNEVIINSENNASDKEIDSYGDNLNKAKSEQQLNVEEENRNADSEKHFGEPSATVQVKDKTENNQEVCGDTVIRKFYKKTHNY